MFLRYDLSVIKKSVFYICLGTAFIGVSSFAAYTPIDFQAVTSQQELKLNDLREKEIQQLQLVLSRGVGDGAQVADMHLRIAELYTEKYKFYFNKESEIWSRKMDVYLRMPIDQQKRRPREVIDNEVSRQWLDKAVRVLAKVSTSGYSRVDEVYYYLGFNLWELGKKQEAAKYFEKISTNHSRSRYSSEAHRYLGDYFFGTRNFAKSLENYKQSAKNNESPAKARVLYGLAWSQFKLKDYKDATNTMRDAIRTARSSGAGADKMGIGLQKDAYDSLALFYSESGNVSAAMEYFTQSLGKADAGELLKKLAANYQRQGKYAKALEINKQLIAIGAQSNQAGDDQRFTLLLDSIRVANTSGDHVKELALIKSLVSDFILNRKQIFEDRLEQIRMIVRKTALLAHQEGNKSNTSKPAFARAEELYRLYLSAFAGGIKPEDRAEISYLLADAISQQSRHKDAATAFKNILNASITNPADASLNKYQKDCALGVIFSLDAYFKEQAAGNKATPEEADELISSIDVYLKIFPKDKDAVKYIARAAGLLVSQKRMDDARPRLLSLVEEFPSTKQGMDAAAELLKDAEARKDWKYASEISEKFLKNRTLLSQDKSGEFRAKLQTILSRAKFLEVKSIEDTQNYAEAAARYEKLAAESKDTEVRLKAYNNAAVSYSKAGDRVNELRIYRKMFEFHPDQEALTKNILGVATDYFYEGKYSEAADVYEYYYKLYEKNLPKFKADKQQQILDVLKGAAFLRQAMNQDEKSTEDFRMIISASNAGVVSARAVAEISLFDLANKRRDAKNHIDAIHAYQKYISSFPNGKFLIEATFKIGEGYAELQEDEKSLNHYNLVISKVRAKGKNAEASELAFAAHARLLLLSILEKNFLAAPLRLPEAQLKKDIANKLEAMDRLNKGYIEVVEFGDGAWAVEALQRMANAYKTFAYDLEHAPIPQEYTNEDRIKFKTQIKGIAQPVYVKVNETLENALRKGEQLMVAGMPMAKVYLATVLASARPDRYPLYQEINTNKSLDWLMGDLDVDDISAKRKELRAKPENLDLWVAVGNHHMLKGEVSLAKIFYQRAIEKNSKFLPALNNLSYIEARSGNLQMALSGFKSALEYDEFAMQPKKNLAKIYMSSCLWRHANLLYRQLEVRNPSLQEVKIGLGLSYLAIGKISLAEPLLQGFIAGDSFNAKFAKAVLLMAKGDSSKAKNILADEASGNEFADMVYKVWQK